MSGKNKAGIARKFGVTALAIGAVAFIAFGGAGAASAATGTTNAGVRDLQVVPLAPAVNFATPGTVGSITYNGGTGEPAGTVVYSAGDFSTQVFNVPVGLEFLDACPADIPGLASYECTLSNDDRTLTLVTTILQEGYADSTDWNTVTVSPFQVQSTGEPIVGVPSIQTTLAAGLTPSTTPDVSGIVVGEEPPAGPLVLGGALAAAGLGAGALVISRRRKHAA